MLLLKALMVLGFSVCVSPIFWGVVRLRVSGLMVSGSELGGGFRVLGFGCVYSVCAVGAPFTLGIGGAPTYRALASACSPAPTTPTILN